MADILPLRAITADLHANLTGPTPILVDARQAAELLGIGLRTIRAMDAAGKLPSPVRVSNCVRWRLSELHAWTEAGCPDRETWVIRRAARS
jgi:excisionase family DNA binding protein